MAQNEVKICIELGEISRAHDQGATTVKLSIPNHEKGSTSFQKDEFTIFEKDKFNKLKEARGKLDKQVTTKPKIRKVVLLRDHKNFKSYCEPRVVSLGPIHHGMPKYQLTEEYKLVLADDFIEKSCMCREKLYKMVKTNIEQLRERYDEEVTKNISDEALAWILFVDGCATLQFIDSVVRNKVKEFKIKNDHVAFVQQDLFLLENQLPYELLDDLMKMCAKEGNLRTSILNFINGQSMLEKDDPMSEKLRAMATNGEAVHLLDLLRKRLLANSITKSPEDKFSKNDQSDEKDGHLFHNVQELKAVGIRLKPNNSKCLGQISFTKMWNFLPGILRLPPITVDDSTGPKFFNLIAYEMCPDYENDYGVTSYIAFLDSLIDEAKDVMYLRKASILFNYLGSDEEVAQLFNGIGTDLVPNFEIYKDVRSNIQDYYKKKWRTWMSEFFHTHFNSPWTVMAFLAALFAVLATGVQTVYSVLSYYKQP